MEVELCCDLEVDVNGEEVFMVDKKIIASYSGRLSKMFGKSKAATSNLKLIFHHFPGGAEGFELMLKFCYNNGKIRISPSNICLLHCAAQFMEMNHSVSKIGNLLEQTEKSVEEINYWTWSELLISLKQFQDMKDSVSDSSVILEKLINSVVVKLNLATETSPCPSTSSPDSSAFRLSVDTKSTESLRTNSSRVTRWFEDLLFLNPVLVEMLTKSMLKTKLDHFVISKFLILYQKSKFFTATTDEKCKILKVTIDMFCNLEKQSVSCKTLFGILRVALNLNINKSSRSKLENMIGSRLDEATSDNLLVPPPYGVNYLYDVNLIVRFLKALKRGGANLLQLKRVGKLMDLYMAEVAPDPCLKPSKFSALSTALPDSARDSYDGMYRAMDMYLGVHSGMSEEEKMKICCALNYEKLSAETCLLLLKNPKFPSKSSIQAVLSQQSKLKSLLHRADNPKSVASSPCRSTEGKKRTEKEEGCEQVVVYAGKLDLPTDNEKMRAHLQGMQWRVMELEKVCRKMQTQMGKVMKSRPSSHSNPRSLPWLCS